MLHKTLLYVPLAINRTSSRYITASLFPVSPPKAKFSPTSLAFGNRVINTRSVSQVVTLANNSGGPLTLEEIFTGGDYTEYATCGATRAAGTNDTLVVAFTPAGPDYS